MSNVGKAKVPRFCYLGNTQTHVKCWDNIEQKFHHLAPEEWIEIRGFKIKLMMEMKKSQEEVNLETD